MLIVITLAVPKSPPLPTGAELDILAVLWRLQPCTAREVHDALKAETGYTTTLKQMQLMTAKGLVRRNERFRSHVYEAFVPQEHTQKQIAKDVIRRVFGGSAKNLVLGALSAQPASQADLEEIRRMIDAEQERPGKPIERGGQGEGHRIMVGFVRSQGFSPMSSPAPAPAPTQDELKAQVGDLDKVSRVVKVVGFVASDPSFTGQPGVINGASELLVKAFGDKGVHARSAVGVSGLPENISVEIEAIFEVE